MFVDKLRTNKYAHETAYGRTQWSNCDSCSSFIVSKPPISCFTYSIRKNCTETPDYYLSNKEHLEAIEVLQAYQSCPSSNNCENCRQFERYAQAKLFDNGYAWKVHDDEGYQKSSNTTVYINYWYAIYFRYKAWNCRERHHYKVTWDYTQQQLQKNKPSIWCGLIISTHLWWAKFILTAFLNIKWFHY